MTCSQEESGEGSPPSLRPGRISVIALAAQVSERAMLLVLTVAVAKYLGAGRELDIALLALAVPAAIGDLLEAVCYVALLPFFSRAGTAGGEAAEWRLANRFINTTGLAVVVLTAVYLGLLPWAARMLARGYAPAELAAVVHLGWVAGPIILLRGIGGTLAALLMSKGAAWPALGRLAARAASRVGFFFLLYGVSSGATAFVGAACASDAVALFVCLPAVLRIKGRFSYRMLDFLPANALRSVLSQAGSQSAISGFNSLILILERGIAAGMPAGSVAVLNYSRGLGVLPQITGRSVVAGLYPRFSREAAARQSSLGDTTWRGLRATLFVTIPVAVCLCVVREPLVTLLYRRGEFSEKDVHLVAALVPFYLGACVFGSLFVLASRALYSVLKAGVVARREGISWVIYVITALSLAPLWGTQGLGMAFLLRSLISAILLLWALSRHRILASDRPLRYAVQAALGAGMVALGAQCGYAVALKVVPSSSLLASVVHLAAGLAGGVAGYLPFALTAGRSEVNHLLAALGMRSRGG